MIIDKTIFYLNLGKKLQKIRKDKGYTLEKLNEVAGLGINKSTLSAIENGKQKVWPHQLFQIAKVLGVTVDNLIEDSIALNDEKSKEIENLTPDNQDRINQL